MPVTLAVTDAQDGSGGLATIAGGGVSDVNSLYRATWTATTGGLSWAAVGSRTGNGTISVDLDPGHYLLQLLNVAGGVTTIVTAYQPLTDAATQSMLDRALDAVVLRIRGLSLSGIDSAKIVKSWLPRVSPQLGETLPAIFVTPGAAESFPGTLTTQDDIGLPIVVNIMAAQNQSTTANINRNTLWREKILSALRFQRLAGVPEAYTMNPEPAGIVHPGFFDQNFFNSALMFRLITRTQRG